MCRKPFPGSPELALALLVAQPLFAVAAELKLGLLSTQSGESWLQESWSLFKLAVRDVNADTALLPNHTLAYIPFDAQADGKVAYSGAESLISAGVVGVLGVGHSDILRPVAVACSAAAVPLVSPTSTAADLASKAGYPFLFRTQPNDESMLKAMVAVIKELQWYVCALLANIDLAPSASEVLGPALEATKLVSSTFYYLKPDTQQNEQFLLKLLGLIRDKGFRIIALHAKASDMGIMWTLVNQTGMHGNGYCWVMTEDAYVAPWARNAADVLVARRVDTDALGLRGAFQARWSSVATRYDQAIHGPFDPVTKLPFYNATDAVIWDTGTGTTGDGVPEQASMSTYDSVFVLAKALHAVAAAGGDPHDGAQVRGALLAAQHAGITGSVRFSDATQDRVVPVEVVLAQGAAAPRLVARATPALADALTADWCAAGCLDAAPARLLALPWSRGRGRIPKDGTELSLARSEVYWTRRLVKDFAWGHMEVGIFLRDHFDKIPCMDVCAANGQRSVACGRCNKTCNKFRFNLSGHADMTGPPLERMRSGSRKSHYWRGLKAELGILYIGRGGFEGGGADDRTVVLKVTFNGQLMKNGVRRQTLISRSCRAGEIGPWHTLRFWKKVPPCEQCLPGRFSAARGVETCTLCQAGRYAAAGRQTACQNCSAGYIAPSEGTSKCEPCEEGKYQPAGGAVSCMACPPPMTTLRAGLTDVASCVCPSGFYRPRGSLLAEGLARGPCEPCPLGMKCHMGADTGSFPGVAGNATRRVYPLLLPQYWSDARDPLSIFECKEGAAQCPGGAPGSCAQRAVGRLCARCEDGYYFSKTEGRCTECPSQHLSWLLFPTLVGIASILVVIPLYCIHRDKGRLSWNSSKMVFGQIVTILLIYLQIAACTRTMNLDMPLPKVDLIMMAARPFNFVQLECSGITTFPSTVAVNLLMPTWCASILGAAGLASHVLSKVLKRPLLDLNVLLCCFGGAFNAFFTMICSISLSTFKCYGHPNGERSVISAPQVLCSSEEWYRVVAGSVAAVLVYCGLFLACVIYGLRASRTQLRDERFHQRWKFLLVKFRPRFDWWFLVVLVKGLLVNLVQVVFDNGQDQLSFVMVILMMYTVATLVHYPWRHMTCNRADIMVHLVLLFFCSTLDWYVRGERSADNWRGHVIAYGIWLPIPLQALHLCYHVVAHVRSHWGKKRSSVRLEAKPALVEPFAAFALMPKAELLKLLESMAPLDRVALEQANVILKRQLQTHALQSTANSPKLTFEKSGEALQDPQGESSHEGSSSYAEDPTRDRAESVDEGGSSSYVEDPTGDGARISDAESEASSKYAI